jgi:hypothetical protein
VNKTSSLWPAVALVATVVAGVVLLSALSVDTTTLVSLVPVLVVPLLGYLISQVQAVKHQTNGNTTALLDQVKALTTALANSVPVSTVSPAVPVSAPPAPSDGPDGLDESPDVR